MLFQTISEKDSDTGFDSYNDENRDTKATSEEVISQDGKESQEKKGENQEDHDR